MGYFPNVSLFASDAYPLNPVLYPCVEPLFSTFSPGAADDPAAADGKPSLRLRSREEAEADADGQKRKRRRRHREKAEPDGCQQGQTQSMCLR